MGKILAGAPGASASCLQNQDEDRWKWASDNLAAALKKIKADWKRTTEAPPDTLAACSDEAWDEDSDYVELLKAETAYMFSLSEELKPTWSARRRAINSARKAVRTCQQVQFPSHPPLMHSSSGISHMSRGVFGQPENPHY